MLQCLLLSWPERALSTKGQRTGALIGADTAAGGGGWYGLVRDREIKRERKDTGRKKKENMEGTHHQSG